MAKPHSYFVLVNILLILMALSCSNRDAALDSFNRGVEAGKNGNFDLASTLLTEAIQLNPKSAHCYSNRALPVLRRAN
ncbi:hypothetical protein ACFL5Q_06805, partial [Planctomycetota bacterium]